MVLRKKIPTHYKISGYYPDSVNKFRTHRPSLGRQLLFELLILIEMIIMLQVITSVDNPNSLINDQVIAYKKNIVLISMTFNTI